MVVEVKIKYTNASKDFNFLNIIQDGMRYGSFDDSFTIEENVISDSIVVFDSKKICRGHEICFHDGFITLSLALPTNENDIIFFYHHIKSICSMFEINNFIRDGNEASLNQINSFIEFDKNASIQALEDMKIKIFEGQYVNMIIYGAINPVVFGEKEIDIINSDLQKFGDYMDERQRIDAYYAKAKFFLDKEKSLFGSFTIGDNVTSIFPLNPQPIFCKEKIPRFFVGFVVDHEFVGNIPYKDFIENIDKSNKYDADHIIIQLSKNEICDLINRFKTDI